MHAILFRKVEVDGIKYYQLFGEENEFEPDENCTDFLHRGEKDYFYIDVNQNIQIPNPSLLNIYYDSRDGFVELNDSNIFLKVFEEFKTVYNIIINEIKSIDDVVDNVSKTIMFQDEVVAQLVQRIYLNQSYVISDLPIELKRRQKPNILFHGTSGSGKKSIVRCLQKELQIPYVHLSLTGNVREELGTIITTLLSRSNDIPEVASTGIVYIEDNFEELEDALGGFEGVAKVINYLSSQGIITYDGKDIDFRTLTFVILFDDDKNEVDFNTAQRLFDCDLELSTKELTNEQKMEALFSDNGRINHYDNFLRKYGCKFVVDGKCLMNLVEKCSQLNPSMDAINKLIDAIVQYSTYNGITDVVINNENMEIFNEFINQQLGIMDKNKDTGKKMIGKYLFEKEVNQIFDEAKKYYIGQDKNLRLLITDILNNIMVAEKKELYSPQKYKLNILVRGGTGSGKTFLVDTVCNIFKKMGTVYHAVDTSTFTESGYYGPSVDKIFTSLYYAAGGDLEKAQKGIVFLDELDKKSDKTGDRSQATTKSVLNELLKPAEGVVLRLNIGSEAYPNYINFDTSRVTFICAGAFEGIEEIRDKRIGKRKIGFNNINKEQKDEDITNEDYIAYGMPAQFMGRVKEYLDLSEPTIESILDVLNNSDLNALKIAKYQFALRELDIDFTDDFCKELAKRAIERKEGMRGVENDLQRILKKINHQDIKASEVEKIVLDKEVITDPSKVILVPREKKAGKQKIKKIEI